MFWNKYRCTFILNFLKSRNSVVNSILDLQSTLPFIIIFFIIFKYLAWFGLVLWCLTPLVVVREKVAVPKPGKFILKHEMEPFTKTLFNMVFLCYI
jgi:hypothetical protein